MKKNLRQGVAIVGLMACGALSGCCMGGTSPTPITPVSPLGTAPVAPIPAPGVAPAMAGLVTLNAGPGMTPDPLTTTGLAGGPVPASSLSPDCYAGSFPAQPQVTLHVTGAMPSLTIIASGDSDLTLAVRRPNGTFACDDDGDVSVNPRVSEPGTVGDYTIYVGTFGGDSAAPFTLGVTSYPAMAATLLTEGAVLRHGHLQVVTSSGMGMVTPGTICDYIQVSHPGAPGGLDVRWRVVCGTTALYGNGNSGEGTAGFSYTSQPTWAPGTLINDSEPSGVDSDPSFVWDATGIRIVDDSAGWNGDHVTTFVEVP